MKIKYIFLIAVLAGTFTSCQDALEQPLKFDVTVEPATGVNITDSVITAAKGTTVKFNFAGEPDFISFAYERFVPTNATLSFSTQAAWGTHIENTLSVYVSESFPGLLLNDFGKDSTAVSTHSWLDVTSTSNLPKVANTKQKAEIQVNNYRGKTLTIAFRYKTDFVADWQPTWIVSDLLIDNTLTTDNSKVSTYLAATMGFSPFDMLNKTAAYNSESLAGVWYINNPAAMEIKRTARDNALNHDWLISKPIEIPLGQTENSAVASIKNISSRVENYSYTFSKAGEYIVKFYASNQNYVHSESTEKTLKIRITE